MLIMKKSLLTLSLLAVTLVSANAQRAAFKAGKVANRQVPVAMKAMKQSGRALLNAKVGTAATFKAADIAKTRKSFRAEGADSVSAVYMMPYGSFVAGLSKDWYSYKNDLYFSPALEKAVFPNYSYWDETKDVTNTWEIDLSSGTQELEMDENYNGIMEPFGFYPVPTLTVKQGTAVDDFQFSPDSKTVYLGGGTDSIQRALGNADLNLGFYGGFSDAGGFSAKEKFNGTDKVCVGFAEAFDKPIGHTYATSVSLHGYFKKDANGNLPSSAIGENDTLVAEVCTFSEEGKLVPYAMAISTAADEPYFDEYGNVTYVFRFVENDEDFGLIDSPIVLPNEDFIVLLTGFQRLEGSVTVPFAPSNSEDMAWAGHGYAILDDGSISTIGYRSQPNIPQVDLTISFDAAIPMIQLADESTIVDFPVEGGYGITGYNEEDGDPYNDIDFYTLSSAEQWMIVESPEWVEEILFDEEYLEQGYLLWYASAEALPDGVEGRSGQLVFSLYGKEVAVPVKQGKVDLAVEGVKMAQNKQQTAVYNLMGQRMNANAKGLLIKNGKKYLVK